MESEFTSEGKEEIMSEVKNDRPPYLSEDEWHHAILTIERAQKREDEFFLRHGFSYANKGPIATEPHRAWVRAVEFEYKNVGKDKRVMLDTPIARMMFTLGWLVRDQQIEATKKGR